MDFLSQNIEYILAGLAIAGAVIFVARYLVKLTPTPVDDLVVEVVDVAKTALETKAKEIKADKDKSGPTEPQSK